MSLTKTAEGSKAPKSLDAMTPKQLKAVLRQFSATLPVGKAKLLMASAEKADKLALISLIEKEVPSSDLASHVEKAHAVVEEQAQKTTLANRKTNTLNRGGRQYRMQQGNTPATPAQLKEQAAMMRKDPSLFRRMVPEMKNFTDAQVREYADQMDKMASDPAMYAQMQQMNSMDTTSRDALMSVQSRLSGEKPVDDEWIRETVRAFKAKPDTFKSMLNMQATAGGISPESFDPYFNFFAGFSETTLVVFAHAIWWLATAAKPCVKAFKVVDGYMFGYARYPLILIVMVLLYFITVTIFSQLWAFVMFLRSFF